MKIEIKIIPKENYSEENLGWSKGVAIDDFILNPNDIEFEFEDGSTLPYNDFIFFGNEYYYRIFINGRPEKEWGQYFQGIDFIQEIDNVSRET